MTFFANIVTVWNILKIVKMTVRGEKHILKKKVKLTDLEMNIMKVLWEHNQNLTIQNIAEWR